MNDLRPSDNISALKEMKLLGTLVDGVLGRNGSRASENSSGDADLPARSFRQKLVLDAFNYFLSKVVPGLMGFLSVLVFVRLVGVEQYGRYAVVFAFVMAWASGLAAWLSQGILRFQSQWHQPGDAVSFLRSTMAGTVISVAVGAVAVGVAMPAFGVQTGWPVVISLGLLGALIVYSVALARFQASLRSARVLRFEAARSVGCFAIPVALLWITRSKDYRLLLLGIAVGYALPPISSIFSSAKDYTDEWYRWRKSLSVGQGKILGELWRYGWPVALWALCQQSLLISDRYFLQRFSGYSQAGIYASMYDVIVRSFSLLFMPVTLAVHALVMNRWNVGNRRHALRAIWVAVTYQLVLFVPVGVSIVLLAPWVSRVVVGREISGASALVLPLTVGGFLWQVCLLAHKPLEILCQTKRLLAGILAALSINVAGNWLLVPRYGSRASAYLTVASSASYLVLLFVLTPKEELRDAIGADGTSARWKPGSRPAEEVLNV